MNTFRYVVLCISGAAILLFTQYPIAATMQTRGDYAAALARVADMYRNARAKCTPLEGHARNMCIVEANAADKRSKASAEVNYRGTIQSKADSRIADADADLMIARVACNTLARPEKSACVNQATATNLKLAADARKHYSN